jgi:hypothetical protein
MTTISKTREAIVTIPLGNQPVFLSTAVNNFINSLSPVALFCVPVTFNLFFIKNLTRAFKELRN